MLPHQHADRLVGAAATRTQLHKRALLLLADLQHGVQDLLSEVLGSHSEAAIKKGAEGLRLLQQHEDNTGPDAAPSQAILTGTNDSAQEHQDDQGLVSELLQATQQRTDLIARTFGSIDDLQLGIEELLADLNEAVNNGQQFPLDQPGLGQEDITHASHSSCGDLMKAAAATCAAAHRWHSRALHTQQAAAASQQLAWQKAMDAAQASAEATEAEKEAELLRIQGRLPEAMLAMRRAGQLRAAAETAMKQSEAAYQEYRQLLADAAEASSKALQVSQHAQQLELLGLKQEADEALHQAFRCQDEYAGLLKRAQDAQAISNQEKEAATQLERRIAELQAASVAAYAAGDIARGQQLNAEAAALQGDAAAARARSQAAAQEADALLSQARQLSHQAGSAGAQAQDLLSSKQRLQGVTAQRHAQRLLQQAAQALGAAQQGHAEASALEELDKTYQEQRAAALTAAEQLEREGRHEEAAVQRAAAASWANLSAFVAGSALAARAEAVRKGKVGAALQRAATLAATGSCGGAAATEAARAALEELMGEDRRQAAAEDAARELRELLRGRAGGQAAQEGPSVPDQEILTADTEEAQQQALRLDQQLLLAAEHLSRGRRSSVSSQPADLSAQQTAALDGVALEHMAQVMKLGRLGQCWREQARLARSKADDLLVQAKGLDFEAHAAETHALDLENQAREASATGQDDLAAELMQRSGQARDEARGMSRQADQLRKQAGSLYQDAEVALRHAQNMAKSIQALDESAHTFHEAWQAAKVASSHPSPSHTSHTVVPSPASIRSGPGRRSADTQSLRASSPQGLSETGAYAGRHSSNRIAGAANFTPSSARSPHQTADQAGVVSPLMLRLQTGSPSYQPVQLAGSNMHRRHTASVGGPPGGGEAQPSPVSRLHPPAGAKQPEARADTVGSLSQWQAANGKAAPGVGTSPDLASPSLAASLAHQLQVGRQPGHNAPSASGVEQHYEMGSTGDSRQPAALASILQSLPFDMPYLHSPLLARPRVRSSAAGLKAAGRQSRQSGDAQQVPSLMSKWLPSGQRRTPSNGRPSEPSHAGHGSRSVPGSDPAGMSPEGIQGIEMVESELVSIRSLMHATGSALQLLDQDAASQDKAIQELQRRAEQAADEARLAREQVNTLRAGGHDTASAEMAAQLAEEVAQRSVLLLDIRAHEAQATAQQVDRLHQKLQHLQTASACLEESKLTGLAASNAAAACEPAEAAAQLLLQQARQAEQQAEEEQLQASVAQQLSHQLAATGKTLDAAELNISIQAMSAHVQQSLKSAARLRVDAARAERAAHSTRRQAATLQRRTQHLKDMSALALQLAAASSHSAQLIFLHAQILMLSAEMQAEATGLRLQDLEAQMMNEPSDRVHQLAQPHLQERSKTLLAAAADLWELVQDAHQYEVPALTQLCDQLHQLMAAEEQAALDEGQGSAGDASGQDKDEAVLEHLQRLVRHGQHVAGLLARFRDVRQQMAEALVMQSAGRVRSGSIVRSRTLFSTSLEPDQVPAVPSSSQDAAVAESSESGALHVRDFKAAEAEHVCLRAAVHGVLQAHDLLRSAEQLSAGMTGLPSKLREEQGRAAEFRRQAASLRQSCQPYSQQLAAAEALAHSLQEQQQLSQARAASNAVGLLLSQAEASLRSASAAEQLAQQSDARCKRIQALLDTLDQIIGACVRLADALDMEAGIHAAQGQAHAASSTQEQQTRLQVLAAYKQRLQEVLATLRQLCLVQEQAVSIITGKSGTSDSDAEQQLKDLDKQAQTASAALAKRVLQLQGPEAAAVLLDASDRYRAQAESCGASAAKCQAEIPSLQEAAAQAQIHVLRQLAAADQVQPLFGADQQGAQAAADVASWRADAVQLQQVMWHQGLQPLTELSNLALEAAHARLRAVEADQRQEPGQQAHQLEAAAAAQAAADRLQSKEQSFAGKLSMLDLAQELGAAVSAHTQAQQALMDGQQHESSSTGDDLANLHAGAQLASHELFKAVESARGTLAIQAAEEQVQAALATAGTEQGPAAVQHAKSLLAYQQAHAQLAMSHSLTLVGSLLDQAAEQAATCVSDAQAEADAAGQQAREYAQSERDCLAAGRLHDAVAARYAALRANTRTEEMQQLHGMWQTTSDCATQHAGRVRGTQQACRDMQAVVAGAQASITSCRTADASPRQAGESDDRLRVAESACKLAAAATQLRLEAAAAMQAEVKGLKAVCLAKTNSKAIARERAACERAAELAAREGDAVSAQLLAAQAQQAPVEADAAAAEAQMGRQGQIEGALTDACAQHDLAMLYHHLQYLLQDKAALHLKVLLPCRSQLAEVHLGLNTTQQHSKDAASQVAGVNLALDRCKSAAKAAPHSYEPLYLAKSALLQSQLAQVTEQLLDHDQHTHQMKHRQDKMQLQLNVAEAAYALRTACCDIVSTALRLHGQHEVLVPYAEQQPITAQPDGGPSGSQVLTASSPVQVQSIASLALHHLETALRLTKELGLDTDSLAQQFRFARDQQPPGSKVSKGSWEFNQARYHAAQLLTLAADQVSQLLQASHELSRNVRESNRLAEAAQAGHPLVDEAQKVMHRLVCLRIAKVQGLEHLLHDLYHQLRLTAAAMAHRKSTSGDLSASVLPLHVMSSRLESLAALLNHMIPPWLKACQAAEAAAQIVLEKCSNAPVGTRIEGYSGLQEALQQVEVQERLAAAIFEELQLQLELATTWLPADPPTHTPVICEAPQPAAALQGSTASPEQQAALLPAREASQAMGGGNLGRASRQTEEVARSSHTSLPASLRESATARSARGTGAVHSPLSQVNQPDLGGEGLLDDSDLVDDLPKTVQPTRPDSERVTDRLGATATDQVPSPSQHGFLESFRLTRNNADSPPVRHPPDGGHQRKVPAGLHHHDYQHDSPRFGSTPTNMEEGGIREPSVAASLRTHLPTHMSPDQAHILLIAWQHRCQLIHRALHVTEQLRQLARQQLKEAEAGMSKAESVGQTMEYKAAGIGASSWQTARQQLSAAQGKVKDTEVELTRLQEELRDAEGMVERLCLHCCSQQPAPPRSVLLAFRGTSKARLHADQKLGSLSPSAAAALRRSVSNLNLGRGTADANSPYRHANITPKVTIADLKLAGRLDRAGQRVGGLGEPWTSHHDCCEEEAAFSDTSSCDVDPRPGFLMHQVLTTSGLLLDESPGSLLSSKVPGGREPLEESILPKGQAAAWASTLAGLKQQEDVLATRLATLKHQEAEVLLQARNQSAKASEILMQDTLMLMPSATRATPLTQRMKLGVDNDDSAVRQLQAERYNKKSDALTSWASELNGVIQEVLLMQARLQSDLHALSRAQGRLIEAGALELTALKAHKEATELVCQALMLAVEHGAAAPSYDLGRFEPGAPASRQETLQAIHALQVAARERSEASLKSRSACLEHGQHACDTYLAALSSTAQRLGQIASVFEKHADKLAAQHTIHVHQQEECAEKASQASRASLKATASGNQALGQKLGKAAEKWRTSSISAGNKTAAYLQEVHQLRQEARALYDSAEQLQAQGKIDEQRLSKTLDTIMSDVLRTTRALALALPELLQPPTSFTLKPPLSSPDSYQPRPPSAYHHTPVTTRQQHDAAGRASAFFMPESRQQHHPGDAAASRLITLHDKLKRLEQQVATNKRMAVADAQIAASSAGSSPALRSVYTRVERSPRQESAQAPSSLGAQHTPEHDMDLREIGRGLRRLGVPGGEQLDAEAAMIKAFRGSRDTQTASRASLLETVLGADVHGEGDTAKHVLATRDRLRSILHN